MKIFLKIDDIHSSNIKAISYSSTENEKTLAVTFANDFEYIYYNVPFEKVCNIFGSTSVGSAFHKEILSGNYQYKKI
jgi:hypothetical protein